MDILDVICKRRSTRRFTPDPISDELIQKLLIAATSAPTAANCQPWEFIVVNDSEVLNTIREEMVFARYSAPLAIVVCGNMKLAFKGSGKEMWVQDCSAATENMLIAATGLGLGSVWIGVYPIEHNVNSVRKILDIPDYIVPLNIIYFGYSDEVKESRSRYNEKRVYFNTYDRDRKHRSKDKPKIGHY
ncbi:MAG: nitroreductase family protein [Clostridiales bacterium]|nr:nitroreductase family protein [Clostridiales bacterium]